MTLEEKLHLRQQSILRDRDYLGRESLCPHQKTHHRADPPRNILQVSRTLYHDTVQVSPPNLSIALPFKDDMS
jgi:hypothetical protein